MYFEKKAFLTDSKGYSIGEVVNHIATLLENLWLNNYVMTLFSQPWRVNSTTFCSILIRKKTDTFEAIVANITSTESVVPLKEYVDV